MKKIATLLVALLTVVTAHAQFEEGKVYLGGSLTGLNLSYNGSEDLNLGLQAQVGYMFRDNWMVTAQAGYNHSGNDNISDQLMVGAGLRYYIIDNGLFLGLNAKLVHANHNYNDLKPGLEVGYAFFLGKSVTLEPAIYYDQSFRNHSDYSTIGLRVGVGVYL